VRKLRVWCRGALNVGRFATLQVRFDTYLLQILEAAGSQMGKGKAGRLSKYQRNKDLAQTTWNVLHKQLRCLPVKERVTRSGFTSRFHTQ
jgi:hypothetical protein